MKQLVAGLVALAALLLGGSAQAQTWTVAHDHGDDFGSYCVGSLTVGRRLVFTPTKGKHGFASDYDRIKEAKPNDFVGVEKNAFHIKFLNNANNNFAIIAGPGYWGHPDKLLVAVHRAMGDDSGLEASGPGPRPERRNDETEIVPGMTMDEVQDLMGDPDEKLRFGNRMKWIYQDLTVVFERGKVVDVKF